MEIPTIVPFVKWVGGKRQLTSFLLSKAPRQFNKYFEPFAGGAAMLFALRPQKAHISDLNDELINAYLVIRDQLETLREYLVLMEYGHSEEFYSRVRMIDQNSTSDSHQLSMSDSAILRAARFIYLNKACFNGVYRVNTSGHFNVPSGHKTSVKTFDWVNLTNMATFLKNQNIILKATSFEHATVNAAKGDFVYFDPPYDFEDNTIGFNQYQKDGFGRDGQLKLLNLCRELDTRGVMFMVSNHNTPFVREGYKQFNIALFNARRLIGGRGASRLDVEEVVVTNFE